MNIADKLYLENIENVIDTGVYTEDRTGTGCYSVTGGMMVFDLSKYFPLLTTKKININNIIGEALWFIDGRTTLPTLRKYSGKPHNSKTIWSDDFEKYWDANSDKPYLRTFEEGGNIYGKQWRSKLSVNPRTHEVVIVDQFKNLLNNIKDVKGGDYTQARRLIVDSWDAFSHTTEKETAALSACHDSFQCLVRGGDTLDLRFHMRSNDLFLGCPYNIGSYAFICHVIAQLSGLKVGKLLYLGTDCHIYSNHVDQVKTQLGREGSNILPQIIMPEFKTLEELLTLTAEDFEVKNYEPDAFIKAPQAS